MAPPLSEDVGRRVDAAMKMVCSYRHRSEIFREMRERFPGATQNEIEYAVELATDAIRELFDVEGDPDTLRAKSVRFYLGIIRNEQLDLKYRIKAQENLERLLALHREKRGGTSVDAALQRFLEEQLDRMREEQ